MGTATLACSQWRLAAAGSSASLWSEGLSGMAFSGEEGSAWWWAYPQSKHPKRRKQKWHGLLRPSLRSHSATLLYHQVLATQSCPSLCNPIVSPGSSVRGILQARILEWVAIPFSRGSSQPRNWTLVSCIEGRFFTIWAIRWPIYHLTNLNLIGQNCHQHILVERRVWRTLALNDRMLKNVEVKLYKCHWHCTRMLWFFSVSLK